MYFQYDTSGTPFGFIFNGTQYFYMTNQMGDVFAITEADGEILCVYAYDEWGKLLGISCADEENEQQIAVANLNPLRYRGYYYDSETEYYYLQSRYYDPSICRFINADIPEIAQMSKDISVDTNLFAYCNNDPINKADYNGALPQYILNVLGSIRGLLTADVFRFLSRLGSMCYLSAVGRALIIYNYIINRRQAKKLNDYIKDQENYSSWRLGFSPLSSNGCEVISIYNVLLKLGRPMKLEDIILASGLCGYVMLYGAFGSSPTSLWRLFSLLSIKYGMTYNANTLNNRGKKAKAIIVSCWNKGWFNGLHTFMVVYSNGKYQSYNGYDDAKYDSIQALLAGRRFIVGYYFN